MSDVTPIFIQIVATPGVKSRWFSLLCPLLYATVSYVGFTGTQVHLGVTLHPLVRLFSRSQAKCQPKEWAEVKVSFSVLTPAHYLAITTLSYICGQMYNML